MEYTIFFPFWAPLDNIRYSGASCAECSTSTAVRVGQAASSRLQLTCIISRVLSYFLSSSPESRVSYNSFALILVRDGRTLGLTAGNQQKYKQENIERLWLCCIFVKVNEKYLSSYELKHDILIGVTLKFGLSVT